MPRSVYRCESLGLPLLIQISSNVLEGDGAFDLLASEDGLVVPADKDSNVAGGLWRHDGARPGGGEGKGSIEVATNQVVITCLVSTIVASKFVDWRWTRSPDRCIERHGLSELAGDGS